LNRPQLQPQAEELRDSTQPVADKIRVLAQRAMLFYPLILAAYPVSFWYAENARETFLLEVMVTLAMVVTTTVLVTLLLRSLVKDDTKVAVIVSIFLVLFLSLVPINHFLVERQVSIAGLLIGRYRFLFPVSAAIAGTVVSLIVIHRSNLAPLVQIVTGTVLLLLVFNVVRIASDHLAGSPEILIDGQALNAIPLAPANEDQLPDIYYIILDAYARADVLQENFDFDNSRFIDSLTAKGFFVASESRSNYIHTEQSLASSLSMQYLQKNQEPIPLIKENAIAQLLKNQGYQYAHLSSGFLPTDRNKRADLEYRDTNPKWLLVNDFSFEFVRNTVVWPLADLAGYEVRNTFLGKSAQRFKDSMGWLREIPDNPSPTFTFSHNYVPHAPFVFDRDGNIWSDIWPYGTSPSKPEANQRYVDQLYFVSKTVDSVIDDILKRSSREPIIIVQGDHGPPASVKVNKSADGAPLAYRVLERTAIFNAYYLPEHCRSSVYPTITPVNTFRVILNACLGADFDLLPDESYWESIESPIDFELLQR